MSVTNQLSAGSSPGALARLTTHKGLLCAVAFYDHREQGGESTWALTTVFIVFLFFVLFFNLTEARVIWEEEALVEKIPPIDWPMGMSVGAFSRLMIGVEGPWGRWS